MLDFVETFIPLVKRGTIRVIITSGLSFEWILRQLDINDTFLNSTLLEEVYMQQLSGFKFMLIMYVNYSNPYMASKRPKSLV